MLGYIRLFGLTVLIALGLSSGAVRADGLALVIENKTYTHLPAPWRRSAVSDMVQLLERSGFETLTARDQGLQDTVETIQAFRDKIGGSKRVVIVVAGQYARSVDGGWLLARGAREPDDFQIAARAISIDALVNMGRKRPGQAVVLFVEAENTRFELGQGVSPGLKLSEAPQGVTVAQGTQGAILKLLRDGILQPGKSLKDAMAAGGNDVRRMGYLPGGTAFIPAQTGQASAGVTPELRERLYWNAVRDIGTPDAYRAYLDAFPNGRFSREARQSMGQSSNAQNQQSQTEAGEAALQLTREQRMRIQRDLSLLGYNTRGVDGIFGRGTRFAISGWQRSNGFSPADGFLNELQINRLRGQARDHARRLAAEAEARRREEERRDRAYWAGLGQNPGGGALRGYLQAFPDGIYATRAQQLLAEIERDLRRKARAEDRAAWDKAEMAGTLKAYRAYLNAYPEGRFADTAKDRIEALSDPTDALKDRDREQEELVAGNVVTRVLIERQLDRLGLEPGAVDGNFTRDSRRAIRRFQRANGIDATGFVSQQTLVFLLAAQ